MPFYSGEYLAYGNSFLLQTMTGAPDYTSSASDYTAEIIANAPPSNVNQWYKYHTSSEDRGAYTTITAPSTSTNMLTMLVAVNDSVSSHSGMYQKLSGLVAGFQYEVAINFHYSINVGTISFSRFYYANQNFTTAIQTPTTTYALPSKQIKFTFTAKTTTDIVFFDFSGTIGTSCSISSIEIKEQNNTLTSVVADIPMAGISKVLRRTGNERIPLDEGEPKE